MTSLHSVVVKFAAEVATNSRRGTLLETMTVFIKYENTSTPQRSESREVAQFAADKMIRLFIKEGSDDQPPDHSVDSS